MNLIWFKSYKVMCSNGFKLCVAYGFKLEINNEKLSRKSLSVWKLYRTVLNSPGIIGEEGNYTMFWTERNTKMQCIKNCVWVVTKGEFSGKFIAQRHMLEKMSGLKSTTSASTLWRK